MYSRWPNQCNEYVIFFFHMSLFLHAHLLHTIFQFAWYYYCQDRSTILWDSIELQPTEIRYLIRCNRLKVAFLSINFDFAEKKASNPPLFFSSWWGANNKDMLVSPSINSSFLKKYSSVHLKTMCIYTRTKYLFT